MTAADGVFALVLLSSLILGARRGFFKEVVHLLAVLVGIWLAKTLRAPAGAWISNASGLPRVPAEVLGILGVWIAGFLASAVLGRLVLKKLRGKGVDDRLDSGAEAIADAIGGDTTKGPVTRLTDPIASKRGLFYWSDKLLGMGLGLLKGAVTAYVLFGLVVWADRVGWSSSFARSIEASFAASVFQRHVGPLLVSWPEYKIATSVDDMKAIVDTVKADPRRAETLANHQQLRALQNDPRVKEAMADPEVRRQWAERDLGGLLLNPKVQALLSDPDLRQRVAEVDWDAVRADVGHGSTGSAGGDPETPPPGPR